MKVINFDETPSLVSQYMAELRDVNVQKDMMRFRRNLERIGQIMAYEISKTLSYKKEEVITPLAAAQCEVIDENIV
ncbi:MAG: uracil phosphoribosyltransferase, partial [Paramuribaculum sp.]|nr:uracil phosphoribosyltransferase [Paramuribaculum sp.]